MLTDTPIITFKNDRFDNCNPNIFEESRFCFNKLMFTAASANRTIKLIVVRTR